MTTTTPTLIYRLKNLRNVVVQKTYVGKSYVYVLQLVNGQTDGIIFRMPLSAAIQNGTALDLDFTNAERVYLDGFGHGQTLEFMNKYDAAGNPYFLVATKGVKTTSSETLWDTQLGRVAFINGKHYNKNTDIARMAYLNYTSQSTYTMARVGGAIDTQQKNILIAGLDTSGNMHFATYDLSDINRELEKVESSKGYVDMRKMTAQKTPFTISSFEKSLGINSIQGFEFSNGNAIMFLVVSLQVI